MLLHLPVRICYMISSIKITRFIGRAVCHQLPQRSFHMGGYQLPLCARCSGMYLAIGVSLMFLLIRKRQNANKPPSLFEGGLIVLGMLPLMIDGVSSYLGWRETNNLLRYISGAMFAYMLPLMFTMVRNFNPDDNNDIPAVRSAGEMAVILLCSMIPLAALQINNYAAYVIISIASSTSVVLVAYSICKAIIGSIFKQRNVRVPSVIFSALMIIIMSNFNSFLLDMIVK